MRNGSNPGRGPLLVLAAAALVATVVLSYRGDAAPGESEPAKEGFAGSVSCRSCHERFYQLWSKSHHGLAMQPFTATLAAEQLGPLERPIAIGDSRFTVDFAATPPTMIETTRDGTGKAYPVAHAMGGKNVFFFLTPMERGRLQVLPLAYDVRRKEWYDTTQSMIRHALEDDQPVHWTDPMLTFNTSCYSCHVSQLRTNYDLETDTYRTEWAEPGINCETCHGPAEEHVKAFTEAPEGYHPIDWRIISTSSFTHKQHNDGCSTCHAKGSAITDSYPPGEHFFDHFDLTTLEDRDYYPDGRDLGENYTATSWRMNPCLKGEAMDCMHCHTSSGRFRFKDNPDRSCLPCHTMHVRDVREHSRHEAKEGAPGCIDCHMPMTEFGRMLRSDHSMRPPVPAATIAFKSPNACNLCHTDETPAAMEAALEERRKTEGRPWRDRIMREGKLVQAARAGDWRQLASMLSYLEEPGRDEIVATSLLRLFGGCEDGGKWPVIERQLADRSPLVRAAAAQALQGAPRAEAVAALAKATADERRLVRVRAAYALAEVPEALVPEEHREAMTAAFAEFEASCRARQDSWSSHFNLGNFYCARGRLEDAAASLAVAHRLRPDITPPLVNVSTVYARMGEREQAEAALRKAVKIDPNGASGQFNLGLLLAETGDLTGAERHLRAALRADGAMAPAAYNLAVLLLQMDETDDEAIALLHRAATRVSVPRYAYTLAFYLRQRGDREEALAVLDRLATTHPGYLDGVFLAVTILREQGRSEAARERLTALLQRDDLHPRDRQRVIMQLQPGQP